MWKHLRIKQTTRFDSRKTLKLTNELEFIAVRYFNIQYSNIEITVYKSSAIFVARIDRFSYSINSQLFAMYGLG